MHDVVQLDRDDDEAAQAWLTVLRDGDIKQRAIAREQLAAVFEHKGLLKEAIELLETNATARRATPTALSTLARLYARRGDHALSTRTLRDAERLLEKAQQPERHESSPFSDMVTALVLIAAGVSVTALTVMLAPMLASVFGESRIFIWYGPVLFGVFLLLRGIVGIVVWGTKALLRTVRD